MAVEYVCERCGETAVTVDAWAEWSVPQQDWAVHTIFEFAFCHNCARETHIFARPVKAAAS